KKHYLNTPTEIQMVLEHIIEGYRGIDYSKIENVNIILVGFNMESLEFNELLNNKLPAHGKIFHICCDEDLEENRNKIRKYLPEFLKRTKNINLKERD